MASQDDNDTARSNVSIIVEDKEQAPILSLGSIEVIAEEECHTTRIVCVPRSLAIQPLCVFDKDDDDDDNSEMDDTDDDSSHCELIVDNDDESILAQWVSAVGCCTSPPPALRNAYDDIPNPTARRVHFGHLDIYQFDLVLGDHPSAVTGPPVALSPTPIQTQRVILDDYEANRLPRRRRKQLKLSYRQRQAALLQQEYTRDDIHTAWTQALKIRAQRRETLARGYWLHVWDDVLESSHRKWQRTWASLGI